MLYSLLLYRLSCLISENCATSMETSVGRSTAVYECAHPLSASIPSTINLPFYVCVMYTSIVTIGSTLGTLLFWW